MEIAMPSNTLNAAGSPEQPTRRTALKAAAGIAALGLSPTAVLSADNELPCAEGADTQILRLFRQVQTLRDGVDHDARFNPAISEETLDARIDEMRAIEDRLMGLPTTCSADLAAKFIIDTHYGCLMSEWETCDLWHEARALTGCPV